MKNQTDNPLSLGEGDTPLLRLRALERNLGWKGELWAKAEYQNPTGSFKDRGSILEIQEAILQKKSGVVCASTGNMAASLAAYAARANLRCVVIIPQQTPEGKLRQARAYGAQLQKSAGDYDECVARAVSFSKQKNLLLCGDYELRRKGQRSIGTELANTAVRFEAFVVPVGNGTVGCAIAEGFAETNQFPKFIGVQGNGADPITQAWIRNKSIAQIRKPKTIASAMKVGNPLDGALTLSWVRKTDGALCSVTDKEIITAQLLLAKTEGIFVETSAAATVAMLKKIQDRSQIIVLILTGSGLKENITS
jgi:threonine synthase